MNQYTDVSGTAITYDANGNLITDGTWTYGYDCENRLTSATNGITAAAYSYDAFGRRVHKSVVGSLVSDIWYLYDGDQVIAEYTSTSLSASDATLTKKYVYGPGIDEPICVTSYTSQTMTRYYYHFDGLGSVVQMTDEQGQVVEQYEYDAYGKTTIKNSTDKILTQSSIGNRYGFTGRELDVETGLYYYRARMYSPGLGRFLQTDPLDYWDDYNLYRYCYNNPVNWVDPMGWCKDDKKDSGPDDTLWDERSEELLKEISDVVELLYIDLPSAGYEIYQDIRDSHPPGYPWTGNPRVDTAIEAINVITTVAEQIINYGGEHNGRD